MGVALVVGLAARYFLDPEVVKLLLLVFFLGALLGTTYMFVAAMVLFEKGESTLDAVIVSPLPTRDYILSKVVTLTGFGAGLIPLAAYFIGEPWQFLAGIYPPYWTFKAYWVAVSGGGGWWIYLSIGAVTSLATLWAMMGRFESIAYRS